MQWTDDSGRLYGDDAYGGAHPQAYEQDQGHPQGHGYGGGGIATDTDTMTWNPAEVPEFAARAGTQQHGYGGGVTQQGYGHPVYGAGPEQSVGGWGAAPPHGPDPVVTMWHAPGTDAEGDWRTSGEGPPAGWPGAGPQATASGHAAAWQSDGTDPTAEWPAVGEEVPPTAPRQEQDGSGYPPPDVPPTNAGRCEDAEAGPVFVDSSGRRQRRVRRAARLLVIPAGGYVALLISTMLGGPSLDAPFVPSTNAHHPSSAPPASAPDSPSAARTAATATPGRGVPTTAAPQPVAHVSPSAAPTAPGSSATHPSNGKGHGLGSTHRPNK